MIDLHIHSSASDGTSKPIDLLRAAQQIGLTAIAFTDHDTLEGFDAALPFAANFDFELVCGIELSTVFLNAGPTAIPMHLMGYFPGQLPNDEFRGWLRSISTWRCERNLQLMAKLQALHMEICWDDLAGFGPDRAARPHFAKVLVAKGYVADVQTAFDVYLKDSVLGDIRSDLPSTQEAIDQVSRNGGIASLAHPGRLDLTASTLRNVAEELTKAGLSAIEVYHSDHKPETQKLLQRMSKEFGLLATGGSDYHGDNKPDIQLGTGRNGNVQVPDGILENMKRMCPPIMEEKLQRSLIRPVRLHVL